MNGRFFLYLSILFLGLSACQMEPGAQQAPGTDSYDDLVLLFNEWRDFETPPILNGAPGYTAETFERRRPAF